MNLTKIQPALVLGMLLTASNLSAQTSTNTVILYNSEAIKVHLSENGDILNFYGVAEGYMDGYQLVKTVEKIEPIKLENVSPTFTNESQNAQYAILADEREGFSFSKNVAVLNDAHLKSLNKAARHIKSGTYEKVIVTVYDKGESKKLLENRLSAVVTYLKIKGVKHEVILTEYQKNTVGSGFDLAVSYTR